MPFGRGFPAGVARDAPHRSPRDRNSLAPAGFSRAFWTCKSQCGRTDRPTVGSEFADFVRTMAFANSLGGAIAWWEPTKIRWTSVRRPQSRAPIEPSYNRQLSDRVLANDRRYRRHLGLDQSSTARSLKREKSAVFAVTTTSSFTWAIAAICPSTYGAGRPRSWSRAPRCA